MSFKIVFFKSCMFEGKIRSKTAESMQRDHDRWFQIVKEKKFIPEPAKKALSEYETEQAGEVNLKKTEHEVYDPIRDLMKPAMGGVKKNYLLDSDLKTFRYVIKVTIVLLAIALFLFIYSYFMMMKRIDFLENRVNELSLVINAAKPVAETVVEGVIFSEL
jgi:hypothetical protein